MPSIKTPAEMRELLSKTTQGEWTTTRPGRDKATGFTKGLIVAGTGPGMGIWADPPGGSYPNNDREFIAAAHNSMSHYLDRIEGQDAQIKKLRARLEVDHIYQMVDGGGMARVEADLDEEYDGISCRDETIKLQDKQIAKARDRIEEMEKALREIAKQKMMWELEDVLDGCDFDYAYDKMIEVARSVLPPVEKPEGKDE